MASLSRKYQMNLALSQWLRVITANGESLNLDVEKDLEMS